jgi:hypothetical protein
MATSTSGALKPILVRTLSEVSQKLKEQDFIEKCYDLKHFITSHTSDRETRDNILKVIKAMEVASGLKLLPLILKQMEEK